MSSLSDFTAPRVSGGLNIKYYTTPGTKTLVLHEGVDKRVYVGSYDGTISVTGGDPILEGSVFLATSDFQIDVTLVSGYAAIQYLVQED